MAKLGSYMTYHNSQFLVLVVDLDHGGATGLAAKVTSMELYVILVECEGLCKFLARRGA